MFNIFLVKYLFIIQKDIKIIHFLFKFNLYPIKIVFLGKIF